MKDELLKRGWYENPDKDSMAFHLKFVVRMKDVNQSNL